MVIGHIAFYVGGRQNVYLVQQLVTRAPKQLGSGRCSNRSAEFVVSVVRCCVSLPWADGIISRRIFITVFMLYLYKVHLKTGQLLKIDINHQSE